MSLCFSANLSTLFSEVELVERFQKAADAGFKFVEIQNPYDYDAAILKKNKGALECDLINIYSETPFGCAAIPVHEGEFSMSTQHVIPYYDALNFKKLHILSGKKSPNFTKEHHMTTLIENLNALVYSDFLENRNLIGLIEPICTEVVENYFLNSFEMAIEVIKAVNSDQIKLLLDIYHLHKITGDVPQYLEQYYPYAGHIQVSQHPGRTEPFCEGGHIDYSFVFDFLRKRKHTDPIGLEYFPSGSTLDSFTWMKNYI